MKRNLLKSLWLMALLLVVGNVRAQGDGTDPTKPFHVYCKEYLHGTWMSAEEFKKFKLTNKNALALIDEQDVKKYKVEEGTGRLIEDGYIIDDFTNLIIAYTAGHSKLYECTTLQIYDDEDWVSPVEEFDVIEDLIYERQLSSSGLNSVCLPFKVTINDLPESPVGAENQTLMLQFSGKIEGGYAYFGNIGTAEAGNAFLLKCTSTGKWSVRKSVTLPETIKIRSVIPSSNMLVGSYTTETLYGDNKYKVSGGKLVYIDPNGGSHLYPFRAYLAPMENTMPIGGNGSSAPTLNMMIENSEATSICNTSIDDSQIISEVFSVNGVKQSELKRGVNVVRMSDGSIKKLIKK